MHTHAYLSPPTKVAVYTFPTSPSSSLWNVNKNQMSVNYVEEMVHNKNRETGLFSTEKMEVAIPHQAFKCVTHKHRFAQKRGDLCLGFNFTLRCQLIDPS